MPIYEYQCKNCKETTEILQTSSDEFEVSCICTGSPIPMKKIISHSTFILKGDGWYASKQQKETQGKE